ncbi:hypothetical protein [Neorhizobium tomejilense]|uniref:hypothetical protein n=1 Tax=Neorhizobium tomejilense TaxID=2093828 RepID=UPI00155DEC9F|nr:hypothetical protein [Neorhizobium tomejilense]
MESNRRAVLLAGLGLATLHGPSSSWAQDGGVAAAELEATLREDNKFEQMLLSVSTLRLVLAIAVMKDQPQAPAALADSAKDFGAIVADVRKGRGEALAALKADNAPITFSRTINSSLNRIGETLADAGVEPGSRLADALLKNMSLFLAVTVKRGQSVESWFCGIFPFRQFCG